MTKREFLNAIAATENLSAELREYAEKAISTLDATNKKRAEKPSKAHEENLAFVPAVTEYLDNCSVAVPASLVAENCNLPSTSKANAVLKLMVDAGTVKIEKIKSTAKSGGKINGYILVRE